jgi:hypothetical protein
MPDDPHDTPDMESALDELRQAMNDISFVAGVVVDLRRSSTRLLSPLKDELIKLRERIDRVLPLLPLLAAAVLLSSCAHPLGYMPPVHLTVTDFVHETSPAPLVLLQPDVWNCSQPSGSPQQACLECQTPTWTKVDRDQQREMPSGVYQPTGQREAVWLAPGSVVNLCLHRAQRSTYH